MEHKPARAPKYRERPCLDCGEQFTPLSGRSLRCRECREGPPLRVCGHEGCEAQLFGHNKVGYCGAHRYASDRLPPRVCAKEGCGKRLRSDNLDGWCRPHKSLTAQMPARICAAEDCEKELRSTNKSGYCSGHVHLTPRVVARNAMLRARTANARKQLPVCTFDGCEKRIRLDNQSGRCRSHNYVLAERRECSYGDCETLLNSRNKTGRCMTHRHKHWVAEKCAEDGCERIINGKNTTGFCKEHTSDYYRGTRLQRIYGLTIEQYDAMLEAQGGVCAICRKPPKPGGERNMARLHVDHDHETGAVRALLCNNCNRGLGAFLDDPDLMRLGAAYVEHYARLAAAAA